MVDRTFIDEHLPVEETRPDTVTPIRTNGTAQEKKMNTLWAKHCTGDIHTPELVGFINACKSIAVDEVACMDFVMGRQNLVSPDSSKSDPVELEKLVADQYKRYASQLGQFKTEPIARTPFTGQAPVMNREKVEQEKKQADTDILSRVEQNRIDLASNIIQPKPRLSIDGNPIGTPGNLIVLTGGVKGGKTAVKTAIEAGMIPLCNEGIDTLGITVEANVNQQLVLGIDCEQAHHDQHKGIKGTFRRIGDMDEQPNHVKWYNVRQFSPRERRIALTELLKKYSKEFNGVFAVTVDGFADFVDSVNDEQETNEVIRYFENIAIEYKCVVIGILHYNPGGEKTRGHLGSSLERKCEGQLTISKTVDGISTIESKYLRNSGVTPLLQFAYSTDKGYHVSVGRKDPGSERQEKFDALKNDAIAFLEHGKKQLSRLELAEMFMKAEGIQIRAADGRIAQLIKSNVIYYTTYKKEKLALHELFCK
ncbi:MAG: hypothetical protein EHM20_00710 [Alphaproteobacteria bacterium]|nr:MAG: hypothetical protein EHM20_00710 [Alphaproteobacteria bacterium]